MKVVLDQSQTGNAKSACSLCCFFHQLLVSQAIECARQPRDDR
jgi:hypothetical protein